MWKPFEDNRYLATENPTILIEETGGGRWSKAGT